MARTLAFSPRHGQGYGEIEVADGALYTVLPAGTIMRMPRGHAGWWAEPHSHVIRGCEVVFWQAGICPVCKERERRSTR